MRAWFALCLGIALLPRLFSGVPALPAHAPPPPPSAQAAVVAPAPAGAPSGPPQDCPVRDELSPAQDQALTEQIQAALTGLVGLQGLPAAPEPALAQTVTYAFPLRLAPGLPDSAGFSVSAFSDHKAAADQVLDYNGGARTYDGHRGTDYALWPFGWNKLDAGDMQVVAAAAGTIINAVNVDPTDKNCTTSSADPWNYITLLHADGRLTIYGHLRYNSLTSKTPGKSVVQGEYLAAAGSSGNSSGPHLHFEVRTGGFTNAEWTDPYAGTASQPASLWASQLPYLDSAVNRLSAPPGSPDPCLPDLPNQQFSFTTPARVYFYAYYRDFQGALPTQLALYRPDGSLHSSWQFTAPAYPFSWAWRQGWITNFTAADPAGAWRFSAVYNGRTTQTFFNLNAPPAAALTSPAGGEQWDRLAAHPLTWTANFGGEVNIRLYKGGVFITALAYNTPGDGQWDWTPGPALPAGSGYTVRVSSVLAPSVYAESAAAFALTDGSLTARADAALTLVDTALSIAVLANDASSRGDPLSISAFSQPAHGTASSDTAGTILYTPAPGYIGPDAFTYTVSAGSLQAEGTVSVIVAAALQYIALPLVLR